MRPGAAAGQPAHPRVHREPSWLPGRASLRCSPPPLPTPLPLAPTTLQGLAAVVFLAVPALYSILVLGRLEASGAAAGEAVGGGGEGSTAWRAKVLNGGALLLLETLTTIRPPCSPPHIHPPASAGRSRQAGDAQLFGGPANDARRVGRQADRHPRHAGCECGASRRGVQGVRRGQGLGWWLEQSARSEIPSSAPRPPWSSMNSACCQRKCMQTWVGILLDSGDSNCVAVGEKVCHRERRAAKRQLPPSFTQSPCQASTRPPSPPHTHLYSAAQHWRSAASTCQWCAAP